MSSMESYMIALEIIIIKADLMPIVRYENTKHNINQLIFDNEMNRGTLPKRDFERRGGGDSGTCINA